MSGTLDIDLRLRGATAALWTASNRVLGLYEPGFEADTGRWKVGDGSTGWNALPYMQATASVYEHSQIMPASVWTINHGLGFYPNVYVLDTAHQPASGAVANPTVNQTVITFSAAFAGTARLT